MRRNRSAIMTLAPQERRVNYLDHFVRDPKPGAVSPVVHLESGGTQTLTPECVPAHVECDRVLHAVTIGPHLQDVPRANLGRAQNQLRQGR